MPATAFFLSGPKSVSPARLNVGRLVLDLTDVHNMHLKIAGCAKSTTGPDFKWQLLVSGPSSLLFLSIHALSLIPAT